MHAVAVAVVGCGPDVVQSQGSEATAMIDSVTGTVGAGSGPDGATSSAAVDTGEDPTSGDTRGSSAGSSETGSAGEDTATFMPDCPLPQRPNASVTTISPEGELSFGYAWYGPQGGGDCADELVILFLPDDDAFVQGWPDLVEAGNVWNAELGTALRVSTFQTVAMAFPAGGSLVVDGTKETLSAHGLSSWTVEGSDPMPPVLVGTLSLTQGQFVAEGEFEAIWCPAVAGFPPCPR